MVFFEAVTSAARGRIYRENVKRKSAVPNAQDAAFHVRCAFRLK